MYSRNSEESASGIAAMFFLLTTALSAWLVFMTPYLVRGGFAVGGFIGRSVKRLFGKKE